MDLPPLFPLAAASAIVPEQWSLERVGTKLEWNTWACPEYFTQWEFCQAPACGGTVLPTRPARGAARLGSSGISTPARWLEPKFACALWGAREPLVYAYFFLDGGAPEI